MNTTVVFRLLTGAVFVFVVSVLFRDWREVEDYLRSTDYRYLCLALGVHSAAIAATALSWHCLVRQFTGDSRLRSNLRIFYRTLVAKEIPGVIWFVAGRAHLYAQEGISTSVVVTCSVMETVWFCVSGTAVYFLMSPFYSRSIVAANEPLLILLVLPLAVVVLRPDLLASLANVILTKLGRQQIRVVDRSPRWSVLTFLGYAAAWLLGSVVLYCTIVAVHPLPLAELPMVAGFLVASGMVGVMTSMLPAGMGIRELTLAALLGHYVPTPLAIIISLLFRSCVVLDEMVWAAAGLRF